MESTSGVQDYLKIFLISLVTSVVVLFTLGPTMLKLQEKRGPRAQVEEATPAPSAEPPPDQSAQLTAPNLQGLDLREAREQWRAQGIVIIEDSQRVDTSVEADTILSQIPAGGAPLQTKEIRVVVAAAPEMVTVPSVLGKDATEATEALVEAGFEVPAHTTEASAEPPGSVLRQEPNAGSKTEKGSLVRLVVAAEAGAAEAGETGGSEDAEVPVPRVLRMKLKQARSKIENAGLVVGKVTEREHEELGNSRVLSQSPGAGNMVEPGSAVNLVVVAPD
ncbi:serine/threonine protein kinase [Plesiocystis pacifica SIR-1]|uniref:Serine/threonine protein kinase n=1 Tax=Plesiocystis pacifica SIR-1 TaxID=391625 RepID=A6G9G0_9BACT|nr:PASTA domain-containing protein [Plesiocystis pacifica]EDM77468.1 serine/threonine protein kinase [Plesiocystis pacifica SIR-1]